MTKLIKTQDPYTELQAKAITEVFGIKPRTEVEEGQVEELTMDTKTSFLAKAKNNVAAHKKAYIGSAVLITTAATGAGYLSYKYGFKKALAMSAYYSRKYLPAGLIVSGGVGLVATAYLAYKAAPEVEERLTEIEGRREAGEHISSLVAARMIAGPLWKPVLVGAGSIAAISGSYFIMNGRINGLSKLARQQADALTKGMNPTTIKEVTNDEGEVAEIAVEVDAEKNDLLGRWMHYSEEWTSDDITYMVTLIDNVESRMQDRLFERGYLTMNEVLDALGFERTAQGAMLGWTTADTFFLSKKLFNAYEEADGTAPTEIFVQWTPAHSVYDQVSFTGRYSAM